VRVAPAGNHVADMVPDLMRDATCHGQRRLGRFGRRIVRSGLEVRSRPGEAPHRCGRREFVVVACCRKCDLVEANETSLGEVDCRPQALSGDADGIR
jgi:hypothetical protein